MTDYTDTVTVEPYLTAWQAAAVLSWMRELTDAQKFNVKEALEARLGARKFGLAVIRDALNDLGFNITDKEAAEMKRGAEMVVRDA